MIKEFIKDMKLSRLSYLLEVIEVRDFRSKIKAFNKIRKKKLTKEEGELILNSIDIDKINVNSEINIYLSLFSLVVTNYYAEYDDKIEEIYKELTSDSKYEILNILSLSSDKSAILLYKKLLINYYDKTMDIPIGTLSLNKDNYKLLFPELFKALKLKAKRNNILLLLSDFLNYNVVKVEDLKKNKKYVQDSIVEILKEGVNYKFKKDENIMQDSEYIKLRVYLEAAINIEDTVSNRSTKSYLDKLFKKKDNQLKLFILENYIKKGKDISKISLTSIAKDNLSRYPLYSFLMFYNLERLMPKKYANNISLAESDLFINYCINYNYSIIPFDMEYMEDRLINNHKYYVYKFKTNYNYQEEVKDAQTDYILKSTKIDKKLNDNAVLEYVGVSGGYNKDLDPSIIEKNLKKLLFVKLEDDVNKTVDKLLSNIKEEKVVSKEETKKKKEKKKKDKVKDREKLEKEVIEDKENKTKEKLSKEDKKLLKEEKKLQKKLKEEEDEFKEPSLLRRIFSFNTLLILLSLCVIGSGIILYTYVLDMDILKLKGKNLRKASITSLRATTLTSDKFTETGYTDIFAREENEYYVLLFKKKDVSLYNAYLDVILENGYRVCYVDLNNEGNNPIYGGNVTGFIIHDETLLKVKDHEYEFYVVGKTNILKELRSYVEDIEKKKKEAENKAKEEAKQKKAEETKKEGS